jgi:tetrahydromethanopterin S-methyltransferase subunit G
METNNINSMLKKILSQYHIIILFTYIACIIGMSLILKTPNIENELIILIIGLVPLCALGMIFYRNLKKSKSESESKAKVEVEESTLDQFFLLYDVFVLLLMIICFGSISYAINQNLSLFDHTFSYSLRLISTALHPVYPLESRLFHTLAPFSLVSPYGNRKVKKGLWITYFLLVFLLQIKIAPLYLFFLVLIALYQFKMPKKLKLLLLGISAVICGCLYGFTFYESSKGFEKLYQKESLQTKMTEMVPLVEIDNPEFYQNCKRIDNIDPKILSVIESEYPKIIGAATYRIVVLPSIVSRLFVCARENNFNGNFQGHQIARIFGNYLPVYNILYRMYFPEHGTFTFANAVGNFIYDSYFQLGFLGVILSALILIAILLMIEELSGQKKIRGLYNLMKLSFIYSTLTASILSTLIFFFPLLALFSFIKIKEHFVKV